MDTELSNALVRTWVTGWARTRNSDVVHDGHVHTVRPRADDELSEYVLYDPSETDLHRAVSTVAGDPNHLLTLIAATSTQVEEVTGVHGLELISDEEKLMVTDMELHDVEMPITPDAFTTTREDFDGWTLFTTVRTGKVVARGRMAAVDEYAILDRIYTARDHRRRGLGTFVTRALLAIAHDHDVDKGLLMATGRGVELYEHLGWRHLGDVHVFGASGATNRRRPSHAQIDEELS